MLTNELLQKIIEANAFPKLTGPTIVCFRNTDKQGQYVQDTGSNLTDIYYLVDDQRIIGPLEGRSYANASYQAKQTEFFKTQGASGSNANKIASGFYQNAWTRGEHWGCRALCQFSKFIIFRSYDAVFENADDFTHADIVADNFHGWAPGSAGCCTVKGAMTKVNFAKAFDIIPNQVASDDWALCDKWIYETHMNDASKFHAMILDHEDLQAPRALRPGSKGERVAKLQEMLKITPDSDYFMQTFAAVRSLQLKEDSLKDSGIADDATLKFLGL